MLPYSCWQMKRTRGRKWKLLPLCYTPAATHTDSAANHGEYLRVSRGLQVLTCIWPSIALHILRITLHCCTNCLRSAVMFAQFAVEQYVLTVLRSNDLAGLGAGVWPVCHYTHPKSCSVPLLLPWEVRKTQWLHSLTGLISIRFWSGCLMLFTF